jgi:hypothetical protein
VTDVACDACCMPPPSSICRFNTGYFMIAVGSIRMKWALYPCKCRLQMCADF